MGICIVKYVIKKVSDRVYEVWELSWENNKFFDMKLVFRNKFIWNGLKFCVLLWGFCVD